MNCIYPSAGGMGTLPSAGEEDNSLAIHNLILLSSHVLSGGCESLRHGYFAEGYHTAAHADILDQSC